MNPNPSTNPNPNPSPDPSTNQNLDTNPQSPQNDATARADQGGTAATTTNAPNLFGDLLGVRSSTITGSMIVPGAFRGTVFGTAAATQDPHPGAGTVYPKGVGTYALSGSLSNPNQPFPTTPQQALANGTIPIIANADAIKAALQTYALTPAALNTILKTEKAANSLATIHSIQIGTPQGAFSATPPAPVVLEYYYDSYGVLMTRASGPGAASLRAAPPAAATKTTTLAGLVAIPRRVNRTDTAVPIVPPPPPVPAGPIVLTDTAITPLTPPPTTTPPVTTAEGSILYGAEVTTLVNNPFAILVPLPSSGGPVGLVKTSEDNSPFPRDRLIFTYDYFDSVPITTGGASGSTIPVNKFQFGFEKTAFNGRVSFEMRVPFANTLSSDATIGSNAQATEFGNTRLAGKLLFLRGEVFNFSGGLAFYLPTANDVSLKNAAGAEAIHVSNKSVQIAPFLAAMYTPNPHFFAQVWYGLTFDTGGAPVTVNTAALGGIGGNVSTNLGNLTAPTLMTIDGQIGMWIYQEEQGLVRGIAPFLELHYAGNVGKGTVLDAGNGFLVGGVQNFNEFNLSGGVTTRLAQNTSLAVGAAVPLLSQRQRTFDYQIGVRLNWYFGYTARQRQNGSASANSPNSF